MQYDIIFFSGTGGTRLAAEKLSSALTISGATCTVHDIGKDGFNFTGSSGDMLIVMYPVHAFGAPIPVYEAIDRLTAEKGGFAAVISISAGGEAPANGGCRIKAIRKLRSKGYNVVYEDMIMMPSNWAVRDSEEIESMVINALDPKVKIISEVLFDSNSRKLPVPGRGISFYSRIMAAVGTFSRRIGFPFMGKFFRASDSCNCCSICTVHCPQKNIKMINGKPRFGWKCVVCMRCIYACPMNSISAGPFNFMIVDGGYDMAKLTENAKKYSDRLHKLSDENISNHKAVVKYINEINSSDVEEQKQ